MHRFSGKNIADLNRSLKNTLAIVLAGGRGSRLLHLTESEAKPGILFGGKYRIIDFPLSNCINSGLRRISVITQYRAHTLIHHVQRAWGFLRAELNEFVEIWPAQQQTSAGNWYQGTADAVFQNLDTIMGHHPEYVLILAGDHVYKQDYSVMLADHIAHDADCTVSCIEVPKQDATGFGVIGVDEHDNIISFVEKPKDPPTLPGRPDISFASMGIYIFKARFLADLLKSDANLAHSSHDFGKDILPSLIGHCKIIAHRFTESCVRNHRLATAYWRDVGTVDSYWAANIDLTNITPELDLYDMKWPIWTHQEQWPAAKFIFNDDNRRGQAFDSVISAGCIISGATVNRSLMSCNTRANSFSRIEECVLLPGTVIGRHCNLRKAIIDSNCAIPEGLVVGQDPDLDAKRFHRTKGGVVLITQEMLEKL
ncbi:MAG TPA: glucose-1-phosphate adenylyltransferase [Rhodospirillaceae bacterium]|nr:MAG: glucose-1-phosphate adenylyltransferase [Alphaproteobacteria bacterium GWF2_58_20]HAU28575.1 glucose-1-phosphate adenylyltransferase [Rhodospirillaceae bacterium]